MTHVPLTDFVKPFELESSSLRGRIVCLETVLDQILSAHDYPNPVAHLVAENTVLTLLLSSMLKYEGIFTLQARGDGPISLLVADVLSNGDVRSCANFDPQRLEVSRQALSALKASGKDDNHLAQYLGQGHIAFTVDQVGSDASYGAGENHRYQGVVALEGASLKDCIQHYFTQSEQIKTGLKLAIGKQEGRWYARGIMIQKMPEDDGRTDNEDISNIREDDWRRAMILLGSCTDEELLDPSITSENLLLRLFHEDGVRVYDPHPVQKKCRCTLERVQGVIAGLPEEEREYLVKDGAIEVTCDFCSALYRLDPKTNVAL